MSEDFATSKSAKNMIPKNDIRSVGNNWKKFRKKPIVVESQMSNDFATSKNKISGLLSYTRNGIDGKYAEPLDVREWTIPQLITRLQEIDKEVNGVYEPEKEKSVVENTHKDFTNYLDE